MSDLSGSFIYHHAPFTGATWFSYGYVYPAVADLNHGSSNCLEASNLTVIVSGKNNSTAILRKAIRL